MPKFPPTVDELIEEFDELEDWDERYDLIIDLGREPADDQFAQILASACRQPAEPGEIAAVNDYSVNVCLTGPGGSLEAACQMMQAGDAILAAGGAGAFIDNSAVAHGGKNWSAMTADGGIDAITLAFVGSVASPSGTMRYLCSANVPVADSHLLGDENGPMFQAITQESGSFPKDGPMHNPWGRLKLVSIKDIAASN